MQCRAKIIYRQGLVVAGLKEREARTRSLNKETAVKASFCVWLHEVQWSVVYIYK